MKALSKKAPAQRSTNLEWLRIVSMVLIVMSHSDEWLGLAAAYKTSLGGNKLITDFLHAGGQVGVGCFLLLSGYFMVDQPFRLKRLLRLLGTVWFYTLSIWGVSVAVQLINGSFALNAASIKSAIFAFFPVTFSYYWFVTAYVLLMLLSPFLNKLIHALDKGTYQAFLAVIIAIFFVADGGLPAVFRGMAEGRLFPVLGLYFVAGYLKLHVDPHKPCAKKHLLLALAAYALLYASFYGITLVGELLHSDRIKSMCYFWRPLNSPLVLLICVELFLTFLRINARQSKLVNKVAGASFGIYLLHANTIVDTLLLPRLFPVSRQTNSLTILLLSLGAVGLVYGVCAAIELLRQNTVEKLWLDLLNRYCDRIEAAFKKWAAALLRQDP